MAVETSSDPLKSAMQELYRARAVEGPLGENGLRTVWHLSPQGAELMSLVDEDGRVRRQELTLLDEHCIWASGQGVRTGRVEAGEARPVSTEVRADPELVPQRLVRAAQALATYEGQDRYILHMQRVLALAREGLEMSSVTSPGPLSPGRDPGARETVATRTVTFTPVAPPAREDGPAAASTPAPQVAPEPEPVLLRYGEPLPNEVLPPVVRKSEGLVMVAVFGVAVVVGLLMLFLLLRGS
ncbi:hypothetical protein NR800_31265 [Corallococcus interemptor]|uniref:hypothetical protein n=1 Tax=Corallococcus TaxID=83461 RepID=UPI001CBF9C61|nr:MULTISPECIES: hypothetical protein [unclassified Corallococcus]MBZ4330679.1 hypothetical protein [Corallococcus sp. AS-1-12]MBZ4375311.1 hypothetical protein [Corallococcus sp. AS-1-6]